MQGIKIPCQLVIIEYSIDTSNAILVKTQVIPHKSLLAARQALDNYLNTQIVRQFISYKIIPIEK